MALSTSSKSEIMNLIGYGLAKFDTELTSYLGFKSKTDFARFVISKGLASTLRAVFNLIGKIRLTLTSLMDVKGGIRETRGNILNY